VSAGRNALAPDAPEAAAPYAHSDAYFTDRKRVVKMAAEPARFLFRRPLPYVDPRAGRGPVARALVAAGSSAMTRRLSTTWLWRQTVWKIEPYLQSWSGGRLTTATGLPVALLETRGARTGQWRRHGVIYFHDGDRVTIAASQAGYPGHPAWYYNLLAHPDVRLGGERFRAHVITDPAERDRLWELADAVFPAFAAYRASAGHHGREIPVIQLTR
jgi:deazaflavin-dependent oxidoreductase (nitroreductase family)